MHIVDWMPTLCKLADVKLGDDLGLDGVSMGEAITGGAELAGERTLYWKTPGAYAVRVGDWKLVTDKKFGKAMLFDLAEDPLEERDLAKAQAVRVDAMLASLKEIASEDRERIR